MRSTDWLVAALAAGLLAGCAGPRAETALRTDGPRMVELFRGAEAVTEPAAGRQTPAAGCPLLRRLFGTCTARAATEAGAAAGGGYADYTRTAQNELELLFPRLPNPDILIYVPPHLATEERVPVPGYTTAVPLYERVRYALPGETGVAR